MMWKRITWKAQHLKQCSLSNLKYFGASVLCMLDALHHIYVHARNVCFQHSSQITHTHTHTPTRLAWYSRIFRSTPSASLSCKYMVYYIVQQEILYHIQNTCDIWLWLIAWWNAFEHAMAIVNRSGNVFLACVDNCEQQTVIAKRATPKLLVFHQAREFFVLLFIRMWLFLSIHGRQP